MSYEPPRSTASVPQDASFHPGLLVAGLIVSELAGLGALLAVPHFEQVFVSFDGDLPWLTRAFVRMPWLLCPLPLAVLALWAVWPKRRRDVAALAFGVLLGLAGVALTAVAMYLPIFQLAATI